MPSAEDFAAMEAAYERLSPTPDGFGALTARMPSGAHVTRGRSDDELAVLPGTTHMQVTHRVDLLAPLLETLLG